MKYRIKKVVYGDGRVVYLAQYRDRTLSSETKKMFLWCLLIIPAFAIIPFYITIFFTWETIEECDNEEKAQQYICDEKLKHSFHKNVEAEDRLSKIKVKQVIIPLKKCDHENGG